jgi:predicted enzyme related to lactoylglutathione lyase
MHLRREGSNSGATSVSKQGGRLMPRIIHFEIPSDDPDRTMIFYQGAFGWRIDKWDGPMDYWFLTTGDASEPGIDGAFGIRTDLDEVLTNVIGVEDLDSHVELIPKHGGEIVVPKRALPGIGWLVYFKDSEGNLLGMMQSDPRAR